MQTNTKSTSINNNNDSKSLSKALDDTSQENSYGIVLSTRPITNVSIKQGANSAIMSSMDTIQEIPWTLTSMMERFSFVNSYPWLSTAPSHTVLATIEIPSDLIVNSLTQTPFEAFTFFRGDIEIRVQVTGTPFHQGKIVGVFVPLSDTITGTGIVNNFSSMTVNPCVHLFPNANTSSVLTIPFNSPQIYLDLTNSNPYEINTLGTFYIVVMNQLQLAAGASDNVTVSVFSRFLDSKFKVPRLSTPITFLAMPQAGTTSTLPTISDPYIDAVPQSGTNSMPTLKQPKHNFISDTLSNVESMVNSVLPTNVMTDALTGLFGLLDKPLDPRTDRSLVSTVGRLNFSNGAEMSDKMVLDPSQLFESDNATFGTDIDEMDLSYLFSKFSYLGSFNITTGSTPGTVLASFPINPIPSTITLGVDNQCPLLSYLSFPFNFWRGGITYRLEVIATSLQTCKIFVAYNFGTFTVPTVTPPINISTSQYGEAFEINQGTNQIELTVPFVSNTPYKYVPNTNVYTSSNSTGYINVILLNQLVAPSNTPTTITVNVYIAGATDFELSTLTLSNAVIPAVPQSGSTDPFSSQVAPPMMSNQTNINLAEDKVVAPESVSVTRTPTTVKSHKNLSEYLKKFQPVALTPPPSGTIATRGGSVLYTFDISSLFRLQVDNDATLINPLVLQSTFGLFSHFRSLYRQFKGPLRFKLVESGVLTTSSSGGSSANANSITVYYSPPLHPNPAPGNYLDSFKSQLPIVVGSNYVAEPNVSTRVRPILIPISMTTGVTARSVEFEIPFLSRFNSVIIGQSYTSSFTDLGNIILVIPTNTAIPTYELYVSFGDETRFGNLCTVPKISPLYYRLTNVSPLIPEYPDNYSATPPITNTLVVL
jgi:hypothetical protein